jgi:hypothetical protein
MTPRGAEIHHAVNDDRCGFLAAVERNICKPGEAEIIDIVDPDLLERAVALLVVGPSV